MRSSDDGHREPSAGDVLDDGHRLERLLGAGGMGTVFAATAPDGASVAIKFLRDLLPGPAGARATARFIREARVAAGLASPHIVRVHDSIRAPAAGLPYFVMDLLDGFDLGALIDRLGFVSPTVAVRIVLQACRGLSVAHAAGVVHRDIKPTNVFLSHVPGGVVTVQLCDFGVAKLADEDQGLTQTGNMLGSPLYMSPEQLRSSRRVDARADIWSLAMTLYQALCGKTGFGHLTSLAELAVAMSAREVPPIQERAPWIDPALARVVHGALLRDPDARCPTIDALAAALFPFAGGGERLTYDMLVAPSPDLRSTPAPKSTPPSSWREIACADRFDSTGPTARHGLDDPRVGTTIGRYRLVRLLAEGGMGGIYEARCGDEPPIALKAMILDGEARRPESLRRFLREVRAAMSVRSPHVVRVLDADVDPGGTPYIAMELLSGRDLACHVRNVGPLSPQTAARLFRHVCAGVSAAHALRVVHRDIKPANIFLHETPSGTVVAKLLDFGIAKRHPFGDVDAGSLDLTEGGGVLGSPRYMAPEQARDARTADSRTDVWGVALSLYEALSGQRPWEDCETVAAIIVAVCTRPLPRLESIAPWVPPALADVVHRGLAASREERWESVEVLAEALLPFASQSDPRAGDQVDVAALAVSPRTALVRLDTESPVRRRSRARASATKSRAGRSSSAAWAGGVTAIVAALVFGVFHGPGQTSARAGGSGESRASAGSPSSISSLAAHAAAVEPSPTDLGPPSPESPLEAQPAVTTSRPAGSATTLLAATEASAPGRDAPGTSPSRGAGARPLAAIRGARKPKPSPGPATAPHEPTPIATPGAASIPSGAMTATGATSAPAGGTSGGGSAAPGATSARPNPRENW